MRNAECGIVILSEVERSGTKSKVIPLSRGNVAKRQKGCRPATGPLGNGLNVAQKEAFPLVGKVGNSLCELVG